MGAVGTNVKRYEGPEKLTGRAQYIDDIELPGCLHGVTLRSTIPHGRIKDIRFDPKFPWQECVVASAADVPVNEVALIELDQPLLAGKLVRHPHEPILLIAHPNRTTAYQALKHIKVEYEPLPPVLDFTTSKKAFKTYLIEKGDLKKGFAKADLVVEGEYRVPHQEQAYIENNGMAAWWEDNGTVVVMGSLQCPYYVQKAIKHMFGLPDSKVRIIQTTTGGGFGGKEEYPNMLGGHAAVLARKAGKPVKMMYDRTEDMAATTKRHPALVKHKTGLTKDGKLVAQDIEVVMDGGAYATLSAVVLSRGTLHASGPYECPNVRVRSRTVFTNTPPNGAFRGFGAPQTLFAAELHMERIAKAAGIDSLTLRRRNVLKLGSITSTGQTLDQSVGAVEVLEKTAQRSGYAAKRKANAVWNKDPKKPTWKGIGLALVHHGAGFTGSGETYLKSRAAVTLTRTGEIRVLAASTEMGQGTNTIFAQIAADSLGVPIDRIIVEQPDTFKVPNSGPTVASRTTMIVGGLVQRACKDLLKEYGGKVPRKLAADKTFEVEYEKPKFIEWDDATYKGVAYGCYGYAGFAVELEIDRVTCETRLKKAWTAQDIGKAIHPLLAEGQIIGGSTQGLGYAILEKVVMKDGGMLNANLTNYIIPTTLDTPEFEVTIVEKPYSFGPFGAKGVGELPMDTPGPAVAAAIYDAIGVLIPELPILPERIFEAMKNAQAQR